MGRIGGQFTNITHALWNLATTRDSVASDNMNIH